MAFSPLLQNLVNALRVLPGVGPKSAQRMALHLLERERDAALTLSEALVEAVEKIGECSECRTLSEDTVCEICRSEARDRTLLCVLESPVDMMAIEQTGGYNGLYFVLKGRFE